MIDIQNEDVMPLAKAVTTLPAVRGDRPPHQGTIYRWAKVGLKARSGKRVRLETVWVGGTTMTSREALARFFARRDDVEYAPLSSSDKRHKRALEDQASQAMELLRSHGIGG
jgi:hypothetical protein